MANPSPLPVRLRYLEPVRKHLAKLGPDMIDEGTDLSVLGKSIQKRVKGLSEAESLRLMDEDTAELEKWLSTPGRENDPMRCVLPILPLPDAVEVLLTKKPQGPPERGEVSMELPRGAKVTKENGCWTVEWHRMTLSLYPADHEGMQRNVEQLRHFAKIRPMVENDGMAFGEVRFGDVVGIKCISKVSSPPFQRANYALKVPGGFIVGVLDSISGELDESKWETQFHTIRVLNYFPPANQATVA